MSYDEDIALVMAIVVYGVVKNVADDAVQCVLCVCDLYLAVRHCAARSEARHVRCYEDCRAVQLDDAR